MHGHGGFFRATMPMWENPSLFLDTKVLHIHNKIFVSLLKYVILEGAARCAGLLLAPAEGFGLRPRPILPFGQKKNFYVCFGPNFGNLW